MNPDAVGLINGPFERAWSASDSILYALGVGAGQDELEFTTENSEGIALRALPTMPVVLDTAVLETMHRAGDFDVSQILHGEQSVELHRPLRAEGTLSSEVEITGIHDKGEHALVVCRSRAWDPVDGTPIYTTTWTGFILGGGGFNGDGGNRQRPIAIPERSADHRTVYGTQPNQGLIYRLSGDRHPLHSDPIYSARLGYPRPILHGLCTYGFTGRALLHELCEGDPGRFQAIHARFAAPAFPGEALTVELWRTGEGEAGFQTLGEDGRVVLAAGRCAFT